MKNQLSYLIQYLLKSNNIILDSEELEFQVQSHPTYPSLNALTGVLDHFNIENLALDVPVDDSIIDQLPNTFLAQIEEDNQKHFVVVDKQKEKVKLIYNQKKKVTVSKSVFTDLFTGIMLIADGEESKHKQQSKSNRSLKYFTGVIGLFTLVLTPIIYNVNIIDSLFLITLVLGVYVSLNILKQESGEASFLGNTFCSKPTETVSCNAVLSSKGATIFKSYKLSDLSIIYFASLAVSSLLLIISRETLFIPKLLTIVALPVTIYSIYYQAYKVKKWCFLCLCIVGLIYAQATLAIIDFNVNYNLSSILTLALAFAFTITFWIHQSKLLKSVKTLKVSKVKYFKFKRNFELFNTQLNSSRPISTTIETNNEIVFGNPQGAIKITVISNPLCGHCKSVHSIIETILNQYKDDVQITVRLYVSTKNIDNKATQIALRLQELYHDNKETCLVAMHDIYSKLSINQWVEKWGITKSTDTYIQTLKDNSEWCNNNGINFTPEILINDKVYPKMYDRDDLIYFIENLIEVEQINTQNTQSVF